MLMMIIIRVLEGERAGRVSNIVEKKLLKNWEIQHILMLGVVTMMQLHSDLG